MCEYLCAGCDGWVLLGDGVEFESGGRVWLMHASCFMVWDEERARA